MEEITAVLFFAFAGTVALAAVMLMQRKPETPAQRKRRLYREAEAWEREIDNRIYKTARRYGNPKAKRPTRAPSRARVERRMREMARS